jgi:iron complex outermembrane recepter protein
MMSVRFRVGERLPTWAIAAAISILLYSPAQGDMPNSDTTQQVAASNELSEITVTAQRRTENVQKVPIAITAVSGDALAAQNITSTADLGTVVPGLNITPNVGDAQIFIRGIGTTGEGIEGDVGLYVDGVYIAQQSASLMNLSNIDHIEVLKGPQGTLFGRNAVGGAIQIVTKDPSQTSSVDVSLGYANYNTGTFNLYATTGVADNLAMDLAVYGNRQWDGWGTDLVTHEPLFTSDALQLRNKWLYTPSADTKITLAFDYSRTDSTQGENWHILPGALGVDGKTTFSGFYNTNSDYPWTDLVTQKGLMLRIEQDLGWARGVSISSFRNSSAYIGGDQDVTPLPIILAGGPEDDENYSEELQLLSPQQSKIQWIGGIYYLHDRFGTPFYPVTENPTGTFTTISTTPTTSYAAFGQATVEVLPDTHLTAGLRYTHDKKSLTGEVLFDGVSVESGNQAEDFSKLTYRGVLDHQFTPDVFGYVSYDVGFKSGQYNYFNVTSPAVQPELLDAWQAGVKTEFLDRRLRVNLSGYHYSYKNIQINEVTPGGATLLNAAAAKLYGFDGNVEASLSSSLKLQGALSWEHGRYTQFPNDPSYEPFPGGANGCPALGAAGFAQPCSINGAGKTTVETPTAAGYLALDYTFGWGQSKAELNINESYNSGYYWDPDNRIKQPAFALLGAYAKWFPGDKNYDIRLWAKNITDRKYYTFESAFAFGDIGSPAAPVTYGVSIEAHF